MTPCGGAIDYSDAPRLRAVLVGRRVVGTRGGRSGPGSIDFDLDDGTALTVAPAPGFKLGLCLAGGRIEGIVVVEEHDFGDGALRITPGSARAGIGFIVIVAISPDGAWRPLASVHGSSDGAEGWGLTLTAHPLRTL